MGEILDGKAIAKNLTEGLKLEVLRLKEDGIIPKLSVILAGENAASSIYVENKEKAAGETGISGVVLNFPADVTEEKILSCIGELNRDKKNHGILVQLPLPKHIDQEKVISAIDPAKDVDGFHPENIGRLVAGAKSLTPCTPSAIIHLIESTGIDIAGKDATVVGRSNIVGKPAALMLLGRHATVTICHSKTKNLPEKIRRADIVVAAIGRPEFVKGDWIKKGAIVIDVGINRIKGKKITGDVEFDKARARAAFITPVPGGVGPVTIAMLMRNTVEAAKNQDPKFKIQDPKQIQDPKSKV